MPAAAARKQEYYAIRFGQERSIGEGGGCAGSAGSENGIECVGGSDSRKSVEPLFDIVFADEGEWIGKRHF